MHWLESFMWTMCRVYADVGTFIGLIGLLYFAVRGMIWFSDMLVYTLEYKEEDHDDED